MGNYKVGDRVRIVNKRGTSWNSDGLMDKWQGKVMTIRHIGGSGTYWMIEDVNENGGGWSWLEKDIAEKIISKSIHITANGNTVHAILKDGGKVIKRSKSLCAPSDTFDFEAGARIAFDRLCTSLAENSKFSEPQTEGKPAEPINLYCVKSFKPGEFLTKGKIYTIEKDGAEITYDDGWKTCFSIKTAHFRDKKAIPNYLVPEVKRPAKVGEYIRAVKPSSIPDGRYEVGDILRVINDDSNITEQWVGIAVGFENITRPERPYNNCIIRNSNYVVLDGYKPEPAPTSHTTVNNITIDAKCTNCRRERINEAISTPKLDTKGIYAELERILKMVGI